MTRLDEALAALEAKAEARIRDGLARYGIASADRVIGVPMAGIQMVGKELQPRPRACRRALGDGNRTRRGCSPPMSTIRRW